MGFLSFRRRVKILPGLTLNFGKSGITTSIGPRGAKMTFGGERGSRATFGIPGTGISYTVVSGRKRLQGKKPPRGYSLGKVVICPRCKNVSAYEPEMVGQQLHCPMCDHLFYLGRNVKDAWLPPLVRCKKCKALIAKKAKVCPVCGTKNRHLSGCGCLLILFLLLILLRIICGGTQAKQSQEPTSQEIETYQQ